MNAASGSMVPVLSSPSPCQRQHHHQNGQHQNHHHQQQQQRGLTNAYYNPAYTASAAQDILRSAAMTGGMMLDVNNVATKDAWDVRPMGVMPLFVGAKGNKGAGRTMEMEMLSGIIESSTKRGTWA